MDALLELIETRKMEITEISLAEVTDDFLKYIESLKQTDVAGEDPAVRFALLADFISVASRLILIKSKSLLPDLTLSPDEEAEVKDLEVRLKLYREMKGAGKTVASLWEGHTASYSRVYFLQLSESTGVFYPAPGLSPAVCAESLARIFQTFEAVALETETIKEKIVSLEEKIQEVVARISSMGEATLRGLAANQTRGELVVLFLAILHLAREQLILLEQEHDFSDIIIKKKI